MYKPPLDPTNPIYAYVLKEPYNNEARGVFGDWLQEHGYDDIGEYVVGSVHRNLTTKQRATKELMWRTWISDVSTDQQIMLVWDDGLPSHIDLMTNHRQFLIFNYVRTDEDFDTIYDEPPRIQVNFRHAKIFFYDLVKKFPIREIRMGFCTIYPYHGIMIWDSGAEYHVHHYRAAGFELAQWWRTLQHQFLVPYSSRGLGTYDNIFRGHGDMWLAQCAGAATIRRGRRASSNRRSLVESFPRDVSFVAGHDGFEIHRFQQCVRSIPVEQVVQPMATI